jgi:uncharacterized phage-associated protein
MTFRFNFEKTLQATGILLSLDEKRMDRIRLLKLLYIADRELLAEVGRPLTGDPPVAMKYGPVPSTVYDLVKGVAGRTTEWSRHIVSTDYSVALREDPGRGKLSKREIEKLIEVTERYRGLDDFELSELTHSFPEWAKHYKEDTSIPIPWGEILEAQGKGELGEVVERDEAAGRFLDAVFGNGQSRGKATPSPCATQRSIATRM